MAASSAPSPVGFNLYDLLTRVTPGLFLLTVMTTTISGPMFLLEISDSSFFAVLAVFAGFLTGEIIDSVRMTLFAAPKPFRCLIYEERKSGDRWTDIRSRIDYLFLFKGTASTHFLTSNSIWPKLKRYLRVDDELQDSNEIYLRLVFDIDSELTVMTRRYQTTTQFIQNMRVAVPIALFFIAYSFFADTDVILGTRVLLVITLSVISLYLYFYNAVENIYIRLLLLQFDMKWSNQSGLETNQKSLDEFEI